LDNKGYYIIILTDESAAAALVWGEILTYLDKIWSELRYLYTSLIRFRSTEMIWPAGDSDGSLTSPTDSWTSPDLIRASLNAVSRLGKHSSFRARDSLSVEDVEASVLRLLETFVLCGHVMLRGRGHCPRVAVTVLGKPY
jgi:hypothetical protein